MAQQPSQGAAPLATVVKALEGKEWREELKHIEPVRAIAYHLYASRQISE